MIKLLFCVALLVTSAHTLSNELIKGSHSKGSVGATQEEKFKIWDLEDIAHDLGILELRRLSSYIPLGAEQPKYVLSRALVLGSIDESSKTVLGNWPLTPWSQTIQMKGEGSNWQTRHLVVNALAGNTAEVKDPETMTLATYQYDLPSFKTFTGCLADSPLRYGDIDQNSEKELVLFLDSDLVVFSPSQQKVIFATRFAISDELAPEDVAGWFDGGLEPPSSQYVASSGFGDGLRAAFPATRSFAKIFAGDFDNNGKPDILVWRKLYQSRLKTDPLLGFKFEGELFAHYQLEGGEYQIQFSNPPEDGEFETDPVQQAQIKGWLENKNLTWQKGFPTKSECAGQEGQLIPEMHDALLNDPVVLK
jgi:hypothetical protein